ncbi:MAG: SET domain-containing methyltransferase [Nanoarchaeota archaeon]
MFIPDLIKIKKSHNRKGLFAKKIIKKGETIFHFDGQMGDGAHTNAEALQIDEDKFLESTAKFDDFLNHSCNPNCCIDWQILNLVALKNIQKDEELSFNYNVSEYDLLEGGNFTFKCKCGSKNCLKEIKGFKYLTHIQRKEIQKFISPFLKNKFEQKL